MFLSEAGCARSGRGWSHLHRSGGDGYAADAGEKWQSKDVEALAVQFAARRPGMVVGEGRDRKPDQEMLSVAQAT